MDFDEYQKKTRATAIYPDKDNNIIYPSLGLVGETGEVAEKIKKLIRDKNFEITEEFRKDIKKELGDVLWYIAALASELGLSLQKIAELNIEKVYDRKNRGVLHGSGDNR